MTDLLTPDKLSPDPRRARLRTGRHPNTPAKPATR